MKTSHVKDMCARFKSTASEMDFVRQSIRGVADITRQQLSQSPVGDMTRVAKVAGMCVYRDVRGDTRVVRVRDTVVLRRGTGVDPGLPSVRSICAVAQQSMLDAHRVQAAVAGSHDFVSDMLLGSSKKRGKIPHIAAVLLISKAPRRVVESSAPVWHAIVDGVIMVLADERMFTRDQLRYLHSSYNPVVLAKAQAEGRDIFRCCLTMVKMVCAYYSAAVSGEEAEDLALALTYDISASPAPITSREGVVCRNLGWIERLLATEYSKINRFFGNWEAPETSTAAMFCANFKNIARREG